MGSHSSFMLGFFYGGLARRKSALTLLFQSFMVTAVITFQWMFWGYSLAYSRTAGPFIGDLANFGLRNVSAAPSIGNSSQYFFFLKIRRTPPPQRQKHDHRERY